MMKRLGLGVPRMPWHTARDGFAEFAAWMAMLGSSLEKVAHEIELLQKTEVSELAESYEPDKGASSTMPQKRNPATCEAIIATGRILREQVPAVMACMTQEHERDWWVLHIEWKTLTEMCLLCSASLELTSRLIAGLQVNRERMRQNLDISRGLIMAEAVMMRLSQRIGRSAAHELLYHASMTALEQRRSLGEVLQDDASLRANFEEEEIRELLDPATYLGQTAASVDEIAGRS
jgi:3-carboxy-cis,cis-muconate cycloisomerase